MLVFGDEELSRVTDFICSGKITYSLACTQRHNLTPDIPDSVDCPSPSRADPLYY